MDIRNKNIILTGASSGIGKEMLSLLCRFENVKIVAVARHTDAIPDYDGKVFPFSADVSTKEGVDKVFEYAQNTFRQIDIFIANAGFAYLEKLENPDWNHIENIFNLNVFSPIYALEKLASVSGERNVAFVSTISGAGLVSLPAYALYCSTKAALHHFVETYRLEQKKTIQITSVYPVATKTDFFDKAAHQQNTPTHWPMQDAKTVAEKIVRGIAKGKKKIYPSLLFRLSYPLGRAFPFFLKLYSMEEKTKVKKWLE